MPGRRPGTRTVGSLIGALSVGARPPIDAVLVAVPARDEEGSIVACLRSIDDAAARWGGDVLAVLGADACDDRTASLARRFRPRSMAVMVVEGRWRCPSGARGGITDLGLAALSPAMASTWIASTDADCQVPPAWIQRQVAAADRGADVVLGIVRLDAATPDDLVRRFAAAYPVGATSHPHVHGANLGLRATAYRHVGGWDDRIGVGEEHDLLRRAVAAGLTVDRRSDHPVTTSGRTASRVDGGFASVLARLDGERCGARPGR